MNWHVEIIRFEVICHLSKALEGILSDSLLKSKGLTWFVTLLGEAIQILLLQLRTSSQALTGGYQCLSQFPWLIQGQNIDFNCFLQMGQLLPHN